MAKYFNSLCRLRPGLEDIMKLMHIYVSKIVFSSTRVSVNWLCQLGVCIIFLTNGTCFVFHPVPNIVHTKSHVHFCDFRKVDFINAAFRGGGGGGGGWFNMKMPSHQHRKFHCGDKAILRPSYLHMCLQRYKEWTHLFIIWSWINGLKFEHEYVLNETVWCQLLLNFTGDTHHSFISV